MFKIRTPPYSCSFIGGGGRTGVVFFALPVVDGCRLGGDVCCADCMYIGVRDMRCLYKICS